MPVKYVFKLFLIALGLLFLPCSGNSQLRPIEYNVALDSLSLTKDPEAFIQKSIDYAFRLYMYGDRNGCKTILDKLIPVIDSNKLDQYRVEVLLNLGRVYAETGDLNQGLNFLHEALKLIDDESEQFKGKILSFLGYYYIKADQVDSLTKYFLLAEAWNNENEPYRNWVLYEQWHHFFVNNGDFDKAESLIKKAYEITKPVGKRMDHGLVLHRLQQLASRKNDMTLLAQWIKEYYDMVAQDPNGKSKPMMHGFNLAKGLSDDQRINQFERLLQEGKIWEFKGSIEHIHVQLCQLYLKSNQPDRALAHISKVDTAGHNSRYKEDYLGYLSQIFVQKDNFRKAYEKINEKIEVATLANSEEKLAQLRQLEVKFKSQQQKNEIALLKAEDELKNLKIQKAQNRLNYAILFSLILFALLGGLLYYFLQNRNKTKKLAEQNKVIAEALESKDILLREIHHRVKNNLQVISSLLNLQSNFISDDVALQAINEGKNRVNSMALIHQKLYQEKNLMGIETDIYFNDLIDSLCETYNISETDMEIITDIDNIMLDVDTMIPLGLITNELVSNAFKHAFGTTSTTKNKIRIMMKEINDQLFLTVEDNGKGMKSEDFLSSQSFGNKLIQAFIQKLDAEINIETESGTRINFIIRNYKIAA